MNALHEFWFRWMTDAAVQLSVLIVLVGIIVWLGRRLSARLRYALWTLVLVKALLPPFWSVPFSVVNLLPRYESSVTASVTGTLKEDSERAGDEGVLAEIAGWMDQADGIEYSEIATEPTAIAQEMVERNSSLTFRTLNWSSILFALWLGGAFVFWGVVLYHYVWAVQLLGKGRTVESGPLVETMDRLRKRIGVRVRPRIVLSNAVGSPFLWGLWRPSIALPAEFPGEVSETELESVLLHELTHWKRGDLFVTHLELFVQGIFWFHPLVWPAVWNLRRERESACDEAVLASGCIAAQRYGDSLLNVLEFVRDRSPLPVGFLGVSGILERKTQLQHRLEEIMIQRNRVRRIGLFGWATLLFFAACVLPMAIAKEEPKKPDEKHVETKTTEPEASARGGTSTVHDVRIVGNNQIGAKAIAEIVKLKKGEPFSEAALEEDKKALLQRGWFFNVKSKKEKTADGYVVTFELDERPIVHYVKIVGNKKLTKDVLLEAAKLNPGAALDPKEVQKAKERIEQYYKDNGFELVNVDILAGDTEKDRGVVFKISEQGDLDNLVQKLFGFMYRPLSKEQWKQTAGSHFEIFPHGGVLIMGFDKDSPFKQKGFKKNDIIIGIDNWTVSSWNDMRYIAKNWKDLPAKVRVLVLRDGQLYYSDIARDGEPPKADAENMLVQVNNNEPRVALKEIVFDNDRESPEKTDGKQRQETPDALSVPKIVKMFPENNATNVDPNISQIYLTFDRPMSGGMAWVRQGDGTGLDSDGKAFWTEDRLTCVMPVRLKTNKKYVARLNIEPFIGFHSAEGVPSEGAVYTFETGAGPIDAKKREELAKNSFVNPNPTSFREPTRLEYAEEKGKFFLKSGATKIGAEPLSAAPFVDKDESKYADAASQVQLRQMKLGAALSRPSDEDYAKRWNAMAQRYPDGGLEVVKVIRNGPLDKLGVRPGDLLVGADQWKFNSTSAVSWYNTKRYDKDTTVKAWIFRDDKCYYVDVPIPAVKKPADGGYVSPQGFMYIVYFVPKGDFNGKTHTRLLQESSKVLGKTGLGWGISRARMENGILTGVDATDDPESYKMAIDASPNLKFLRAERMTEKSYQELMDGLTKWEYPPAEDGGYTWYGQQYLITFKPKGDFDPKTQDELFLEAPRSVYAGNYQSTLQDGKLVGTLLTDDKDVLKELIDANPKLEFVKADRLTEKMLREYRNRPKIAKDGGYATPTGFTHVVAIGGKGNFVPKTDTRISKEISDVMQGSRIAFGVVRSRVEDGKQIALELTDDPDGFQKVIDASETLRWIRSERLTKEYYDKYFPDYNNAHFLPPEDGGFVMNGHQYIVTFRPKGDFKPKTEEELFRDLGSRYCRWAFAGCYRTENRDGVLYGRFLTDDAETLKEAINATPVYEFVSAERLTQESYTDYIISKKISPNPSAVARIAGIRKSDWYRLLKSSQKHYVLWDEGTFAYAYDPKNYEVGDSRDVFEKKWVRLLEGPEPGYPGDSILSTYDEAIFGLTMLKSEKAAKLLVKIATERVVKDNAHRHYATKALGMLGDPSVIPDLIPLLYHYNMNCRWDAQVSLVRLTGQNFGNDADAWGKWYDENREKLGKDLPKFDSSRVDWSCGSDDKELKKWCDPEEQKKSDAQW